MAPAQSYFDLQSKHFSRSVILQESEREWHSEFHYFGANVYAYLLAKFGHEIFDFISIQFYESYSRAAMSIHHKGMTAQSYLKYYVEDLMEQGESFQVDFEEDENVHLRNQRVPLPLSKLVFGFANGWALDTGDKVVFMDPQSIQSAYHSLVDDDGKLQQPRGFMFWVIGEEGKNQVDFVPELNKILKIRPNNNDMRSLKDCTAANKTS